MRWESVYGQIKHISPKPNKYFFHKSDMEQWGGAQILNTKINFFPFNFEHINSIQKFKICLWCGLKKEDWSVLKYNFSYSNL